MFKEPELTSKNVFGLAEVEKEKGFVGLTEESIQRLKGCRKIFFVMGTGVTGVGKSTKLSQLINPDFNEFGNHQQEKFVFRASDGPKPVTGVARDNMNFPSFGPMKLSSFCKRWNIETTPEDDEIALVFIDSQGTHAIEENGEGFASSTAILSAGVGLRLCFAGSNHPTKFNFNEIDGALKINMIITKNNQETSGHSFGIVYNDIFSKTKKEQESQERKKKSVKEFTDHWILHNEKLNTPNGFKLRLFENPYKNIDGYWKSMKEIASWITDLARLKKRNFNSFVEIINAAWKSLKELECENHEFIDNLDVDLTFNLKMIINGELEKIINQMNESNEEIYQISIEKILDPETLNIQLNKWNGQALCMFENVVQNIFKFSSIKNDESIQNVIGQNKDKIEMQIKFSIQSSFNECSSISMEQKLNDKINMLNEEKQKLQEENYKKLSDMEKKSNRTNNKIKRTI